MNTSLALAACVFLSITLQAQNRIYVSPNGSADGSSWNKTKSLKKALSKARAGDELWLSTGIYTTSDNNDRTESFFIPSGVKVYGGFDGTEKRFEQRKVDQNLTILSGEIGSKEKSDNAYTVVQLIDVDRETIMDGLTIQGAFANGSGPTADPKRAGGGILIAVSRPELSTEPKLVNCKIEDNFARDGGGVYVNSMAGKASPEFITCTFSNNEADLDGGAVYNDGRRRGVVSPNFASCVFENNVANYGGAIFNQATKGKANPRLSKCTFSNNHAYIRGESLYNIDYQGSARPVLVDCDLESNSVKKSNATLVRSN